MSKCAKFYQKHPILNWGITTIAIFILVFPGATKAAASYKALYQFSPPKNNTLTTNSDNIFEKTNCTANPLACALMDSVPQNSNLHTNLNSNLSQNSTFDLNEDQLGDFILMGVLSILLGVMILVTIVGNVFVIAAILLERNLQNVANYLIVSLAVADLMVACLVMPLGAVYVISNNWIMGPELCDMWTSTDVLCCTASILHLVAIAVDRYWAVTNVDYIHTRNSHRIGVMIFIIWTIALIVSLAPQIPQFRDSEYLFRIEVKKQCLPSQDIKYQIFATCSSFYVPLLMIFVLYWKIFQTARKRIRKRREMKNHNVQKVEKINNNSRVPRNFLIRRKFFRMKRPGSAKCTAEMVSSLVMREGQSTATMEILEEVSELVDESASNDTQNETEQEETTAFTISTSQKVEEPKNDKISPEKLSLTTTNNGSTSHQSDLSASKVEILKEVPHLSVAMPGDKLLPNKKEKKESIEAKRERKAAKTLAIITGAFVICWVPFFIIALVLPLCGQYCSVSDYVMSFALWLGYFNSALNPVLYTIFNPEFRQAFKRILCGSHTRRRNAANIRNFRSGKHR